MFIFCMKYLKNLDLFIISTRWNLIGIPVCMRIIAPNLVQSSTDHLDLSRSQINAAARGLFYSPALHTRDMKMKRGEKMERAKLPAGLVQNAIEISYSFFLQRRMNIFLLHHRSNELRKAKLPIPAE